MSQPLIDRAEAGKPVILLDLDFQTAKELAARLAPEFTATDVEIREAPRADSHVRGFMARMAELWATGKPRAPADVSARLKEHLSECLERASGMSAVSRESALRARRQEPGRFEAVEDALTRPGDG
ncbi:MAG: hypothetical protein HY720_19685 [Planctomycetes bacterium]|nr:hypothetical protein [Planctomycetota bacterium]